MLDLSRQYAAIRDEVVAALAEVVDRQQFILGAPVAAFERSAALQLAWLKQLAAPLVLTLCGLL